MANRLAVVFAAGSVLALIAIADHGRAEPIEKPLAGEPKEPARIRELMPPNRKDASRCYEARLDAEPIDVEDWSNWHWVQVEGQWSDGQPAKTAVAAVKKGKVKRILIQIVTTDDEPGDSGSKYTLWTSLSLEGRKKKPLYSGADCSYQTSRLKFKDGDFVKDEKGEYVSEPVTPQISCGVDCDGGGLVARFDEFEFLEWFREGRERVACIVERRLRRDRREVFAPEGRQ